MMVRSIVTEERHYYGMEEGQVLRERGAVYSAELTMTMRIAVDTG